YRWLWETTFEGIVVHEKSIVVEHNPAFAALVGHAGEDLRGHSIFDFVALESRAEVTQRIAAASTERYECIAVRKDGVRIPIEVLARNHTTDGRTFRISALRDLSEIRTSESRLRTLLGCTKGIVFEFDAKARYLNIWTDDDSLLARPRNELLGKPINEAL